MYKLASEAGLWYNGTLNTVVSGGATNTPDRINLYRRFIMDTLPLRAQNGNTFMYSLIDPETEQERYIGKTDTPQRRLKQHLQDRRKTHKSNWIASLLSRGLEPAMRILEEVPVTQWQERERYWIAYYRSLGCPLTNGSDGGDGIINPTPEDRTKRSENTRRIMSDTSERARRLANLNSAESITRRVESRKSSGYDFPMTPSHCLKVSRSVRLSLENRRGTSDQGKQSPDQRRVYRYTSGRGSGHRFTEDQCKIAKSTFLATYAANHNIAGSCKVAGVNRQTFYNWRDNDKQFSMSFDALVGPRQSTSSKQETFLQEFAVTGSITSSARKCGVKRSVFYYWVENYEQFSIRFHEVKAKLEAWHE